MKVCDLKGCGKPYHGRGLCKQHYQAQWNVSSRPRKTVNPWTKEVKAQVADMLLEKLSASQIVARLAPEIRVSRNAVVGIVHRDITLRGIGLHGHRGAIPKRKSRLPGVRAKPPKPIAAPIVIAAPKRIKPSKPRGVTLMELKRRECKWAVNDAPPKGIHLFCGNPSEPDKPYCAGHIALSYKRPQSTGDRK